MRPPSRHRECSLSSLWPLTLSSCLSCHLVCLSSCLVIISHLSTRAGSPPSVSRILGELLFHLICWVLFTLHFSVSSAEFFCSLTFITSHPQTNLCHTVSMSQNGETALSFTRPSVSSSAVPGISKSHRRIINKCADIVQEFRTGRISKSKASYLLQQSIPHDDANEDLFLSTYEPYFNMLYNFKDILHYKY